MKILSPNEALTRALQIDPQLRLANWKLNDRTQVRLEVPVDGYDAEPWNGVTDYCMYDASGNVWRSFAPGMDRDYSRSGCARSKFAAGSPESRTWPTWWRATASRGETHLTRSA